MCIRYSYNSGAIEARSAGVICGSDCGYDGGNVAIVSCYTNNNKLVGSVAENRDNVTSYYSVGDNSGSCCCYDSIGKIFGRKLTSSR